MNLPVNIKIALRALQVNRMRSALTMLGIIIGVAAVIIMVAVGTGASSRVAEQIRSIGSNLIIVLSGSTTTSGIRLGSGTVVTLTEDDAWAMARELPAIEMAAPTVRGTAQVVYGSQNWSTIIRGGTPEYLFVREWPVVHGREITTQEEAGAAKVALLGQTVATNLFGDADPLGQIIRIKNVPFTVIGVLAPKGQSGWGEDQDDSVVIPLSTAKKKVLGFSQARIRSVRAILVRVWAPELMTEAVAQITTLMRQRHRLQPYQEDDFTVRNLSEVFAAQEESARTMALLLGAIASVSLLVGGIGIMNIMLVSVTERTREIGIRMAVGAREQDILTQFLVEAVTLALIGGAAGIGIGVGGSTLLARLAGWEILLAPSAIVLAFVFSAAVGVFFGYYPARKAASLDPIEALRYE